jgi:hypothetical protein
MLTNLACKISFHILDNQDQDQVYHAFDIYHSSHNIWILHGCGVYNVRKRMHIIGYMRKLLVERIRQKGGLCMRPICIVMI